MIAEQKIIGNTWVSKQLQVSTAVHQDRVVTRQSDGSDSI